MTTLYAVVRDNVETLYAAVSAGFEGAALPAFVRREFDSRTLTRLPRKRKRDATFGCKLAEVSRGAPACRREPGGRIKSARSRRSDGTWHRWPRGGRWGKGTAIKRCDHGLTSGADAILRLVATLEDIRTRANEIRAIAAAHGARNIRVVGSVARGTEREDSDIDLLVTFDPGVGLLEHADLVLQLERLLGRRVDVASERGVRPTVRRNLEADAKPL
jgi:predicted nucleotidyltransferase